VKIRDSDACNAQVSVWCSDKISGHIIGTNPTRRSWSDPDDVSLRTCAMNCDNNLYPYSFHKGGCNFLFADGSVHFINKNVDVGLLAALGTPRGGEVAGAP
jgi:prepilin-type processing-associated H-X9-DG protein